MQYLQHLVPCVSRLEWRGLHDAWPSRKPEEPNNLSTRTAGCAYLAAEGIHSHAPLPPNPCPSGLRKVQRLGSAADPVRPGCKWELHQKHWTINMPMK